jgi:hypothetical protein
MAPLDYQWITNGTPLDDHCNWMTNDGMDHYWITNGSSLSLMATLAFVGDSNRSITITI